VFRRTATTPSRRAPDTGCSTTPARARSPRLLATAAGQGKQTENRYSHWIWRQYASAFWDDVRLDRVLPFREARDDEDEKHVHPLQLDVIDRASCSGATPASAC
jgi:hypothetical protein